MGLYLLTKELMGNILCGSWSVEVMGGWRILDILLLHCLQP